MKSIGLISHLFLAEKNIRRKIKEIKNIEEDEDEDEEMPGTVFSNISKDLHILTLRRYPPDLKRCEDDEINIMNRGIYVNLGIVDIGMPRPLG